MAHADDYMKAPHDIEKYLQPVPQSLNISSKAVVPREEVGSIGMDGALDGTLRAPSAGYPKAPPGLEDLALANSSRETYSSSWSGRLTILVVSSSALAFLYTLRHIPIEQWPVQWQWLRRVLAWVPWVPLLLTMLGTVMTGYRSEYLPDDQHAMELTLARWTAAKDFLDYCQTIRVGTQCNYLESTSIDCLRHLNRSMVTSRQNVRSICPCH
jgi:hypothetical protein